MRENRPWGFYEILIDNPKYKVKRISVNCGKRISYQYHNKREETWVVVEGEGVVTIDNKDLQVEQGSTISIKRGQKHRVKCTSSSCLVFIETQTGEYFGEDDIVRIEDDYGRE